MPDQKPKPRLNWFALKCPKCGHEWVDCCVVPMLVKSFTDRLNAWGKRCPGCGNTPRKGSKDAILMLTGPENKRVLAEHGVKEAVDA